MKRKIKLGDRVKLLTTKVDPLGEKFLAGTIGIVCDDDCQEGPYVELKNSKGQDSWTSFSIDDLEIIESNNN